jgi:homocysteine S-methyltransferase
MVDAIRLLDGGLATELEARGCDLSHVLWSAVVLESNREALAGAHRRYLEAGARVLTTVSYQLSFEGAAQVGWSPQRTHEMLELATRIALEVRDEFGGQRPVLVAGSIGPYGAMLADGSEYRGDYGLSAEDLRQFHGRRFECVASSGVDVLACETIPSELEARVLLDLLGRSPVPGWMSFTLRDGARLSDGSELRGLLTRLAAAHPDGFARLVAVGFNCVPPSLVEPALLALSSEAEQLSLPLIAYPNSGERWDATSGRWLSAAGNESHVAAWPIERWFELGVRYLGGCCRVTPRDIEALSQRIADFS